MQVSAWLLPLAGGCVGSALGVIIRGPAGLWRRSACASCGAALGPIDLVPVVSYLALRGRCRRCGAAIGGFALAIEVAALAVGGAAMLANGGGAMAWINAGLGWALLLAAWIDAETLILPDAITLPLLLAGLAVTAWAAPAALTDHAAAAALGYAGFRLLNAGYRAWRGHDGLGQGDAKLLAVAGAWLGAAALPDVILAGGLIGLAIAAGLYVSGGAARATGRLPFGPALALAIFGLRVAGFGG
jgi:leader peptidase (prepilin peptidase)/N-methyltransferase